MAKRRSQRISRRDFIKTTAVGALAAGAAGAGPFFLFPQRAQAQQKTLKILQWSHFVPAYDKEWFDTVLRDSWGKKHDTNVIVDHISLNEIPARAAAEVEAQKGHDLLMFLAPPAAYENQVIDHKEIVQECERKHGKTIPLAVKSTYNPKTKKYYAFSDSYVPDPGNWHKDMWTAVGYPNGPDSYDDLLDGARKIRKQLGNPCGLGLSQELDTSMAMRAIMWSFGASEQDEEGNVTLNSKNTIESLKYMRALYKDTETPEVFTWDPSSNNRAMLAGKVCFVDNAISITREAEVKNMDIGKKIMISRALKGPVARWASEHVMSCYVIWKFAENKEGAKQFLVDFVDHFHDAFEASAWYNFPCYPSTVPDLQKEIVNDPKASPPDKYKVLGDVLTWATNIGHPGYATAGVDEVFKTWVIPTMFAKVARDEMSPEDAASAADKEVRRIFEKRKNG